MNCVGCGYDIKGGRGGSQLDGCFHFLCTHCLVDATNKTHVVGLRCPGRNGIYKCNGYVSHGALEYMVTEKVFYEYLVRVSAAAEGEARRDEEEMEGAAAITSPGSAKVSAEMDDLKLSDEEKQLGWAHKACLVDHLVRYEGFPDVDSAIGHIDLMPIIETRAVTTCPICLNDKVPAREGVVLKECLHIFCKACLVLHIGAAQTSTVTCPFVEGNYHCREELKPKEVLGIAGIQEYRRHFVDLSLREAAESIPNVFHCLTPDCAGFCIADQPGSTLFQCDICKAPNCVQCKLIHPGTCENYRRQVEREQQNQRDNQNRLVQRQNDQLSEHAINDNLAQKIFMRCPRCNSVIQKNGGCRQMICRKCNHEFEWTGAMT